MDLSVEGRHALFFDDDATASFVNSREALVPWISDASLLIDRYDVRHLLDRIPQRPTAGTRRQRSLDDACDAVSLAELDCERYQDLPPYNEEGGELDSETRVKSDAIGSGAFQAVPFSYGDKNMGSHINSEHSSDFCPPFEVPEFLLGHVPHTEKLHQIMARTAIFVNEHGRQSEIVLRVKQGANPTFGFLMPDHHLHVYFQYLIDHPHILKTCTDSPKKEEEKSNHHSSDTGALSLVGSVYGTGDDDDATLKIENKETEPLSSSAVGNTAVPMKLEHGELTSAIKLPIPVGEKEEKVLSAKKAVSENVTTIAPSRMTVDLEHSATAEKEVEKVQSSQPKNAVDVDSSILEPPSLLKSAMEKVVEFIVRNGRQFEAILINQDRNTGRFPFLLPTNQHHSYYVKILEEEFELKKQGKSLFDQKGDEGRRGRSKKKQVENQEAAELSEGRSFDSQRKDKFKMTLVGQKKDPPDQPTKSIKQPGLSADEAAAIVLAATRGASPALHTTSKNSGATTEEAAASVMAATRGWSPANAPPTIPRDDSRTSRFASEGTSGVSVSTGLSGSTAAKSNKRTCSHNTTSDVIVATVIARSVALAASREADSSEASLTKEQKLKAERLKRAKMFASLIKTGGNRISELATPASHCNGSMEPPNGTDSDTLGLEREGSSAPFVTETSNREHESLKMRHSMNPDDSDLDLKHNRKKRHSSRHRGSRRKHRSPSSDGHSEHDEDKRRKCYEHSRRRRRSHYHSSDSEDGEPYENRWRQHRSRSEQKQESKVGDSRNSVETSEGLSGKMPGNMSEGNHHSDGTEIPNDLRAKIRAMLRETL